MVTKKEQSSESIDDDLDIFEEYQIEMAENEEARGIKERIFELAKKSMDETFQKHPDECRRIIEIMEKYN